MSKSQEIKNTQADLEREKQLLSYHIAEAKGCRIQIGKLYIRLYSLKPAKKKK